MAIETSLPLVGAAADLAAFSTAGFGRRVLFDGERMRAVPVALEPGQEIPLHAPRLDLVVSVLAGVGRVMAGEHARWVRPGDVAVIPAGAARGLRAEGGRLVALHVVSPPPSEADHAFEDAAAWPAPEAAPDVADLIRREHRVLHEGAARLDSLAGALPEMDRERAAGEVGDAVRFLRDGLLPHAREEERSVYPAVERVLGAVGGATRTMAVDHVRIASLVAELETLTERGGGDVPRPRAQRLLHELHALLAVHLRKEEDVYLPLLARLAPDERRAMLAHLAGDHPAEES